VGIQGGDADFRDGVRNENAVFGHAREGIGRDRRGGKCG
jgi:hypothetical protein